MATGFSAKNKRPPSPADPPEPAPAAPRRRRAKAWLLVAVALLVIVALAPMLIGLTPLRNTLLASALAPSQGSLHCRAASLGWFSGQTISDLEIRDPQGELLLSAAEVRCSRSLVGLLADWTELGTIEVVAPHLHVRLRKDGSNLEDFFEPWLAPSDSPAATALALAVRVQEGRINLVDEVRKQHWQLEKLRGQVALAKDPSVPLKVEAAAALAGSTPGTVQFALTLPQAASTDAAGTLKLRSEQFPLVMLQRVLSRYLPGTTVQGTLTTQLVCQWNNSSNVTAEGDVLVNDLQVAAPVLGEDRIALKQLHVPCQFALEGRQLSVERLDVECDLGQLGIQGKLGKELAKGEAYPSALAHQPLRVKGRLDLVRLAEMLPGTLHLRDDTRLTSGEIELTLESSGADGAYRWQGRLAAQRLAAVQNGRPLAWNRPIQITFAAHEDATQLIVDQLRCESEFLEVSASGTPAALTASAHFDLNALAQQLEQLVDLGGWQLAGQGDATFRWSRTPAGAFQSSAELGLTHFQLAGPGRMPWIEERLLFAAEASGALDGWRLRNVRSATLKLDAAADHLDAHLREPIHAVTEVVNWPLEIRLQGALQRWLPRLRAFVTLPELQLAGNSDLTARLDYSTTQVEIEQVHGSVEQLAFHGAGLHIVEPKVELSGKGRWQSDERRLDVPDLTLASTALSLRGESISLKLPHDAPPTLSGNLSWQGSAGRLQRWFDDPQQPSPYRLSGRLAGQARLTRVERETTAQVTLRGSELRLMQQPAIASAGTPGRLVWSEPQMDVDASATYREEADQLQLHQLQLASGTLGLSAGGTIDRLTTNQVLDLTGTLNYDLAQLMPMLEPYLGQGVRLEGRQQVPLQIQGPLALASVEPIPHWSQRLSASGSFAWQRGSIYGFNVGAAKLEAQLGQGAVRIRPCQIPISEGHLTSTASVRLQPAPYELLVPAGPLLHQVRISPEMCDRALKYIAPVLADATRTEGRFSVELEGGRIPLEDPARGDLAGKLVIHQVEVLPGPLAREFILLGKTIEALAHRQPPPVALEENASPLMQIEKQTVDFRLVEGRVYHRGMQMRAGNVMLRTHGSVGLDQTLALVAEVPIQDKWLGQDPIARTLSGQTVQVVIHGTFQRPQLDRRAVQQLAAQMLRNAAQEALSRELNKQLDRLLRP